jgi:diguanylate cyclase (GGDEF)-like protein
VRWVVVLGALLVAAIVAGTAWTIADFRERTLKNAEREFSNTSILLARHFDREFEDLITDQLQIAVLLEGEFSERRNGESVHTTLLSKTNGIGEFELFDRHGALINSSRTWPTTAPGQGGWVDLRRWRPSPAGLDEAVQLFRDPASQGWTLAFVRKLRDSAGGPNGAIVRTVPTSWLESFFSSVALGEHAAVTMFLKDGTMIARFPQRPSLVGQNYRGGPIDRIFGSAATIDHVTSPLDGTQRIAASRMLTRAPIVIVASTSIDSVLSTWRQQTRTLLLVAIASVLVVGSILFLLGRHLVRQQSISRRRLSVAINNMSHGLTMFDASGRLVLCNQRYLEMYGLSATVVKPGILSAEVMAHFRDQGADAREMDRFCAFLKDNAFVKNSLEISFGQGRTAFITREPISEGGWVTTHEDITERKQAHSRIAYLAHYDDLTGLPNRASFREHLQSTLEGLEPGDELALLYLDIDEFKGVNDTLGHPVGDLLLKAVAARLTCCLGPSDHVARLGGDEFAIVKVDAVNIEAFAEMIHHALRDSYDCDGHTISTDVSIGIAIAPQHGNQIDQLVSNADLALYAAKSEGRRTYRLFKSEMDTKAKAKHELANELRRAVVERAFELHFQPLVDLTSGAVTGCEALLRWTSPARGRVSPAEFIPLAEEIGLIEELGEWVLDEACRVAASWPAPMTVAVNVSPIQFKRRTFPLKVASALARSGLAAHRLELEITEALLLHDDETTLSTLNELRSLGIKIALDDFGTGYSSLSYLHRFPIDKIKIDKSFVDTIADEGGSSTIIRAIVQIAASGNKITLAEGVETVPQRELLKRLGCQQMQGYLFSPALPADQLIDLIRGAPSSLRQSAL